MNKMLIGVVVALALVLLVWIFRPSQDCSFSGWKKAVGVELDAAVGKLETAKGKLQITDAQVRDFDTIMKDYALRYDAACQDLRAKRITQGAYDCLRQNMETALDDMRQFIQAVDAAKAMTDATGQKDVILQALNRLRSLSSSRYGSGCVVALDVNPKDLAFNGTMPELSIQIANRGNAPLSFSVDNLPAAFSPIPSTGMVNQGQVATVAIKRTWFDPPATQPVTFSVNTNVVANVVVQLSWDTENASIWKRLSDKGRQLTNGKPITVETALQVVDEAAKPGVPLAEADRYVYASNVLAEARQNEAAQSALATAAVKDASVDKRADTVLMKAVLANRRGQTEKASQYFAASEKLSPTANAVGELFVVLDSIGKGTSAPKVDKPEEVAKQLTEDPTLAKFAVREFCKSPKCTDRLGTILADKAEPAWVKTSPDRAGVGKIMDAMKAIQIQSK